jgi:glycosyltransferase involved in cell wall biosynthesis
MITLVSTNISVSEAVARTLPGRSYVITNPYRDDLFFRSPGVEKNRDLFFVGRMVSDKGIDLLIEAIGILRTRNIEVSATVAGKGPEEDRLRAQVHRLGLNDLVAFVGQVTDLELNRLLNRHRILVVPSRFGEGFGVVVLEGLACGCLVVSSTFGGLPEAVGECGKTFTSGDSCALADVLQDLLANPQNWNKFLNHAKAHLDAHRPPAVADKYLNVLTQVLGKTGKA